jgi:hypothetical protein
MGFKAKPISLRSFCISVLLLSSSFATSMRASAAEAICGRILLRISTRLEFSFSRVSATPMAVSKQVKWEKREHHV